MVLVFTLIICLGVVCIRLLPRLFGQFPCVFLNENNPEWRYGERVVQCSPPTDWQ
jgi:hypothetical protein